MRLTKHFSILPIAVLIVLMTSASSCSEMSPVKAPPVPRTVAQALVYAEVTATVANQVATGLLQAQAISPDNAEKVLKTTTAVMDAVQTGRGMLFSGDQAGAQRALDTVAPQLQSLASFNASHVTPQGVTP